jgi:hypothetical protein
MVAYGYAHRVSRESKTGAVCHVVATIIDSVGTCRGQQRGLVGAGPRRAAAPGTESAWRAWRGGRLRPRSGRPPDRRACPFGVDNLGPRPVRAQSLQPRPGPRHKRLSLVWGPCRSTTPAVKTGQDYANRRRRACSSLLTVHPPHVGDPVPRDPVAAPRDPVAAPHTPGRPTRRSGVSSRYRRRRRIHSAGQGLPTVGGGVGVGAHGCASVVESAPPVGRKPNLSGICQSCGGRLNTPGSLVPGVLREPDPQGSNGRGDQVRPGLVLAQVAEASTSHRASGSDEERPPVTAGCRCVGSLMLTRSQRIMPAL